MKFVISSAAASLVLGLTLSAANAQSFEPKVPNPADPFPENPIATDGTPLPSQADHGPINGNRGPGGLYTGRSVAVDGPLGIVGNVVGTGLGVANSGLGFAGSTIGGGLGAVGIR